ncbi:MAG: hypothetical protein CVU11_07995 [Bacteroidetes bacterium HGW-Bacteroidetes-6]|nr:MAG: hypothetical protein CVU11_07995 [Bacteroidetes bacterium HGW-Bacteroidetes-6]
MNTLNIMTFRLFFNDRKCAGSILRSPNFHKTLRPKKDQKSGLSPAKLRSGIPHSGKIRSGHFRE